jgi:protein-S-isoprenylcysteine O-methyltransferase Ste14
MVARLLIQNAIWICVMAALLFVPAGTLHWPAAWVFLGSIGLLGLGCGVWLLKTDPALMAERMRSPVQDGQPAADKIFVWVFGPAMLIWFIVMGLDARFQGSDAPLALQALGFALLLLALALIMWVMRTNSFAAPVVKVQTERQHRVVTAGPYAYVRHPMYSGAVAFFAGVSLLLGSWWGLAMVPLLATLFAVRTINEERVLVSGLPGYSDYLIKVRFRLLPGVW